MWIALRIMIVFFLAVPAVYSAGPSELILEDGFETQTCANPGPEVCNAIDDDCDDLVDGNDPDLVLIACDNQVGVCAGSMRPAQLCVTGLWFACTATDYLAYSSVYEEVESLCDGFDNDCDGEADEGCASLIAD